jgi:long-chain acyl-CoA synthetase
MTAPSHVRAPRPFNTSLPQHESLVHMLLAAVDAQPNLPAVIVEQQRITYAEMGRAVAGLAQHLASLGAKRGERVILLMANSIEMDVAVMAVMATCAQVAPVNPFLTLPELKKQLGDLSACAILSDKLCEEKAAAVAAEFGIPARLTLGPGGTSLDTWKFDESLQLDRARLPKLDDIALLLFTGGSTGVPKGVNHTHRGLLASILQHVTVWPCKFGEERFLNVAPMFHIWGLAYSAWVPIFTQSTLVMVPRYDADKVVRGLSEHRITVFAGGPAPIYMGLLASPEFAKADLSQLR